MFKKKYIKTKIILENVRLEHMAPSFNRVFLKLKQGKNSCTSKSYPVSHGQVNFIESINFEYKIGMKRQNLMYLFIRIEKNSGYSKYGELKIDVYKLMRERTHFIKALLARCKYNTYLSCTIMYEDDEDESSMSETSISESTMEQTSEMETRFIPQPRNKRPIFKKKFQQTSPCQFQVKISPKRLRELEEQINYLIESVKYDIILNGELL